MAKKEESVGESNEMEGQQCPFCHEKKLVIEIDGKIHELQKEYDEAREHVINLSFG